MKGARRLERRIFHNIEKHEGKNLVFAWTIKLIPEFWRNQEIPEHFWKTYEQVKLDLFQIFLFIPDFIFNYFRQT